MTPEDNPTTQRVYSVIDLLGKGRFARVYHVQDEGGMDQALKLFDKSANETPFRYDNERTALQQLQHPGIVRVLGNGSVAEEKCIVLEKIDGYTLWDFLDELAPSWDAECSRWEYAGPSGLKSASAQQSPQSEPNSIQLKPSSLRFQFSVDLAIDIALSVADALAEVHERDIVHLDINPNNIMMAKHTSGAADERWPPISTPRGLYRPVIIDFNIAQPAQGANNAPRLRRLTTMAGTRQFSPPEQQSPRQGGGAGGVQRAMDVFSLAATTMYVLTGKHPYSDGKATDNAGIKVGSMPHVPQTVLSQIRRALDPVPQRRFQSAAHFGLALAYAALNDSRVHQSAGQSQLSMSECRRHLHDAMRRLRGVLPLGHCPHIEQATWLILDHRYGDRAVAEEVDKPKFANALCVDPSGRFLAPSERCRDGQAILLANPRFGLLQARISSAAADKSSPPAAADKSSPSAVALLNATVAPKFPLPAAPLASDKDTRTKQLYVHGHRNINSSVQHALAIRSTWHDVKRTSAPSRNASNPELFSVECADISDDLVGGPVSTREGQVVGIIVETTPSGATVSKLSDLQTVPSQGHERRYSVANATDSVANATALSYLLRARFPRDKSLPSTDADLRACLNGEPNPFVCHAHIQRAVRAPDNDNVSLLHSLALACKSADTPNDPLLVEAIVACLPRLAKIKAGSIPKTIDQQGLTEVGRLLLRQGKAECAIEFLQASDAAVHRAAAYLMLDKMEAFQNNLKPASRDNHNGLATLLALHDDRSLATLLRAISDARKGDFSSTESISNSDESVPRIKKHLRVFPGAYCLFAHARSLYLASIKDFPGSKIELDKAIRGIQSLREKPRFGEREMLFTWCRVMGTAGDTTSHMSPQTASFVVKHARQGYQSSSELAVLLSDAYLSLIVSKNEGTARHLASLKKFAEKSERLRLRYAYALMWGGDHLRAAAQVGRVATVSTFTNYEKFLWKECMGQCLYAALSEQPQRPEVAKLLDMIASLAPDDDFVPVYAATIPPAPPLPLLESKAMETTLPPSSAPDGPRHNTAAASTRHRPATSVPPPARARLEELIRKEKEQIEVHEREVEVHKRKVEVHKREVATLQRVLLKLKGT